MSDKVIHRSLALFVFLSSLVVYLMTLSRTVVFWDVGEYLASAYLLQNPHPPGAPFLLMVGHLMSMIPFHQDMGYRMHVVSALSGAIVAMFLYLVTVKLILRFRGNPETTSEKVLVFGAALVASLSLAFSSSFWNNSIEFEAKGTAMFFVASILWLALRWSERANEPSNEKYLFLIAYLMGLCVGVRPLALLAVFPVGFIIYFTKKEYSRRSALLAILTMFAVFVAIYPGIVKWFPSMMAGEIFGFSNAGLVLVPFVLTAAAAYFAFTSMKSGRRLLHVVCVSFLLILIGYSTYTMVLIRANVPNLPINENQPGTAARLYSYLNREQYGESPVLTRRYSQEPRHAPTWKNYSSDLDFLFRYQINHMYIRYLLRNYIGAAGDEQDAGVRWKDTLGIPFLLGLLGLFYHFRKDWKMGVTCLSAFLLMGVIFALYQNQQDPQPRERDYFYAGSYFVFSLWIGMGLLAIADFIIKRVRIRRLSGAATVGCVALAVCAVPLNLLRINWHTHDRTGNVVAWDYSYNILQTCARDAILFTNGDNDTFPLWYLQDVEGVRQDIRIVNLSLVNTPWYIHQLKNDEPFGAKKVPISLTDAQIDRVQPVQWEPRQMELPVSREVFESFGVTDTAIINKGKITFTMSPTLQIQGVKAIQTQDIMVWDIVRTNNWERPVYFAVTMGPESKIGLDDYLWMDGMAWRLKPLKGSPGGMGMDADIMSANVMAGNIVPSRQPQYGYLYRGLADSTIYYDENIRRMTVNYRYSFVQLAMYYQSPDNREEGRRVLARMEAALPRNVIPMDYGLMINVMALYDHLGEEERFREYADTIEKTSLQMIEEGQVDMRSYDNPYRILLELYDRRREFGKELGILARLETIYPNDSSIKAMKQRLTAMMNPHSQQGDSAR